MILHLIPFQLNYLIILLYLFTTAIILVIMLRRMAFANREKKRVDVVVLGDLGRSPRMANHATSLAKEGFNVQMFGYGGSDLGKEITQNPNIVIQTMAQPLTHNSLHRYINYIIKCIWQSLTLFWCLLRGGIPDFILLQNPPSIPALVVCYFVSVFFNLMSWLFDCGKTELVLDWHNYGYSIMALSLGPDHAMVKLSKKIEGYFGSRVSKSFCVSNKMKWDLLENFDIEAETLYDKPKETFGSISIQQTHELFVRLGDTNTEFLGCKKGNTVFTQVDNKGTYSWNLKRPALLVSSTSWTEDEDFSILLDALTKYEETVNAGEQIKLPQLICVITGKGPLKEYYCNIIADQKWKNVQVVTPWLEPEDYPKLLASADLGVCLHTSSSGVDLPMKVVDMFGCELPVAAKKFPALSELVVHGSNGIVFDTAEELSHCLEEWFTEFLSSKYIKRNETFKENVKKFKKESWSEHWIKRAKPYFV